MSLLSYLTCFKPIIFFLSMHVHIMHKWHNVEVNPIPFSDVATTKPRRDQLKLPVMIHSFHFSRHRWRHAVNNLSPAIRAKWFESWTFKKNMSWIFSDAAITYTTHLLGIVHVSTHFLWLRAHYYSHQAAHFLHCMRILTIYIYLHAFHLLISGAPPV